MKKSLLCAALAAASVALAQTGEVTPPPGEKPASIGVAPTGDRPDIAGEPTKPPSNETVPERTWKERIEFSGYVKGGYFAVVPPAATDALVGARNGFRLTAARLELNIKLADTLMVVTSIDGSVANRGEIDPLSGNRVVALRDGFVEWKASRFAQFRLGQFKAPYDAESLYGDGSLPFIARSVATDGIVPPDGTPREGLTLDRQVGFQVSSDRLGGDIGVEYAVGVFNGNGANVLNNDNPSVMPVGRVTVLYREMVSVGVNAYYNQITEGDFSSTVGRLTSQRTGYGADLGLHIGGFDALAIFLARHTEHSGTALTPDNGLGVMASVHYAHTSGFEAGLRFSYLDVLDTDPYDQMTEGVAMVGYNMAARGVPFRVLAQYVIRTETPAATVSNNTVEVMGQVTW